MEKGMESGDMIMQGRKWEVNAQLLCYIRGDGSVRQVNAKRRVITFSIFETISGFLFQKTLRYQIFAAQQWYQEKK